MNTTNESISRDKESWPWKSKEQRLHEKTMNKYEKKTRRFMDNKRIFKDDKIATLDQETDKRCKLVASLLGNSREAVQI